MSVFIDGFEIDVALDEDHAYEAQVTPFPVEEGADVADHIQLFPIQVTMRGLVSDTPVGVERPEGSLPSQQALNRLLAIRFAKIPVTITTSLREYRNMVITSLRMPRTAETGDVLEFQVTFTQIEFVTIERTTVTVTIPRGKKKVNRGNKAAKASPSLAPSPSATTKKSASQLHSFIN